MTCRLYLNTHEAHWLYRHEYEKALRGYTLFVAIPRLDRRVSPLPPARHRYCVDSGGFSELQKHGLWRRSAVEYVARVRTIVSQLGPELCDWVAQQDCMCEDLVIYGGIGPRGVVFKGTRQMRGLAPGDPEQDRTTAVRIHQKLSVENYVELVRLAPEIRFLPVLQGQTLEDYEHCDQLFKEAGVDLASAPAVGLGSVCRRQATEEIEEIVDHFHAKGYALHGFGVKTLGLGRYGPKLASADSLAWSEDARRRGGPGHDAVHLPFHSHTRGNCANCAGYAVWWHQQLVNKYQGVVTA